jgi:Zn-dependent alcohol dehydrogenase
VVTNIHPIADTHPRLSLLGLAQWEKQIAGCIFGSVNSRADIPRLLGLYRDGLLDLDSMVTVTYRLRASTRDIGTSATAGTSAASW